MTEGFCAFHMKASKVATMTRIFSLSVEQLLQYFNEDFWKLILTNDLQVSYDKADHATDHMIHASYGRIRRMPKCADFRS